MDGGVGLCVFGDMDDCEVRIDVDDVKRERGVFHPKIERLLLRENKEHTAQLRQLVAIHEAKLTLSPGVYNFNCDVDGIVVLGVNNDLGAGS